MKRVDNNVAVFRLAMALKRYDDACPDVGMGPSHGHFIDQALRELELNETDIGRSWIWLQMRRECDP